MSIKVEIIADSLNTSGNRLTSFILEYPRFIHAELLTHRLFSKNAASSRAIPIEKMIQQIIDNPAVPVWWGKNQSGMQAKEELDDTEKTERFVSELRRIELQNDLINEDVVSGTYIYVYAVTPLKHAKLMWMEGRDKAISTVLALNKIGLHKQICNRILEPWFNIRIILSGTEFENFFALRAHEDAQPELQRLAYLMLESYNNSTPKKLNEGEWHIPFGDKIDENKLYELANKERDLRAMSPVDDEKIIQMTIEELKIKIAIARCARVSYFNYEGKDDYVADIKLCDRLFGNTPKHLSPTEHVAMAKNDSNWYGNFRGFKQKRKFFEDENLKDSRVKK